MHAAPKISSMRVGGMAPHERRSIRCLPPVFSGYITARQCQEGG